MITVCNPKTQLTAFQSYVSCLLATNDDSIYRYHQVSSGCKPFNICVTRESFQTQTLRLMKLQNKKRNLISLQKPRVTFSLDAAQVKVWVQMQWCCGVDLQPGRAELGGVSKSVLVDTL